MGPTREPVFKYSPAKASKIIGKDVVNSMRENIGNIKEIMLDPATGRVAYVVLAFGGVFDMGAKLFAIPFSAFSYDRDEDEYYLNVTKERLKNAPSFDSAHWPPMANAQWHRDMHSFYEKRPYWEMQGTDG